MAPPWRGRTRRIYQELRDRGRAGACRGGRRDREPGRWRRFRTEFPAWRGLRLQDPRLARGPGEEGRGRAGACRGGRRDREPGRWRRFRTEFPAWRGLRLQDPRLARYRDEERRCWGAGGDRNPGRAWT